MSHDIPEWRAHSHALENRHALKESGRIHSKLELVSETEATSPKLPPTVATGGRFCLSMGMQMFAKHCWHFSTLNSVLSVCSSLYILAGSHVGWKSAAPAPAVGTTRKEWRPLAAREMEKEWQLRRGKRLTGYRVASANEREKWGDKNWARVRTAQAASIPGVVWRQTRRCDSAASRLNEQTGQTMQETVKQTFWNLP